MPRTRRASQGGYCYHVLNRGNARRTVFHKDGDYVSFLKLLHEAGERTPIRLLACCLMTNHFHLAVWPRNDGDLSNFMQWLLTAHVRRYHRHYHSTGHVWQGRFKAFPLQDDDHLLAVLRCIERNPLRANMVARAEDWRWSSFVIVQEGCRPKLDAWPIRRPEEWLKPVNEPQTDDEVKRLRESIQRGRPYGTLPWMAKTAQELGLESSLRPRGRPKKQEAGRSLFDDAERDESEGEK